MGGWFPPTCWSSEHRQEEQLEGGTPYSFPVTEDDPRASLQLAVLPPKWPIQTLEATP